ncbi:hypothetical protein ATERTT37_007543 [Aspergillus terreus]
MGTGTPFQKEAWTEYGIGTVIILLRILARAKVVGVKNWQGDDYFTIIALLFWTVSHMPAFPKAELTMLEMIGQFGTNIGFTDAQRAAFSEEEIKVLARGSKCLLAGWTCYVTLIWSLKACMLFFYNRLTLGLWQQKLVKANAFICMGTYTAVILTIFLHCRPLHKNWQVYPDPGLNCSADYVNYIVIAVTNVTKLVIGILLCGGVFVMVATLLRCILSLQSIDSINTSTIWAIRETFVAILSVNAPCIKPLFSSTVWLGSSRETSNKGGRLGSYSLSVFGKSKPSQLASETTNIRHRDSDEYALHDSAYAHEVRGGESASEEELGRRKDAIQVTTMYEVRSHDMDARR